MALDRAIRDFRGGCFCLASSCSQQRSPDGRKRCYYKIPTAIYQFSGSIWSAYIAFNRSGIVLLA